jgi:hypothetical protein
MVVAGLLQRCGTVPSESCSCHADGKALMRSGLRPGPSKAPPVVHEVLAMAGERLEANVRLTMQRRLGRDFSQVRVHAGLRADDAAASVSARAFTVGSDIVFGRGQYAPGTAAGASLLTHELAHVVQQRGVDRRPANLVVGPADSRQEHEAEGLADNIAPATWPASALTPAAVVQRQVLSGWDIDEAEDVPDPDLAVQDGSSPVTGSAEDELSDDQLSSDPSYAEMDADELGGIFVARAPAGKPKSSAKKAPPKAKPRLITEIDVDLGAQKLTLRWNDGASESHRVSTGRGCPNTTGNPCPGRYCTPTGDWTAGDTYGADKTNSDGDAIAWFVRVVGGIGIHNSQFADGTPRSHGCIRVGDREPEDMDFAKKINKHVTTSTKIHVSGTAPTKPWHMSKENMAKFHFDGCPAPAPKKPASTPTTRTRPGKVR